MTDPIGGPPAAPPPPPPAGGSPGGHTPAGNPWDRRDELGFGNAFIETLKGFVMSPGRAYAETRESGDFAGPLIFAVLVGWVGAIANQLWNAIFGASMMQFLPPEVQDQFGMWMVGGGVQIVGSLLMAPVFILIGLFIWSGILHLCILLVGGTADSRAGFEGTFRVLSFGSVAQLGNLVPVAGGLITLVWSIVLAVIGLSTLHRTSQGKALFAVLIPFIFCCVCLGIGLFMFGASMAAFFANQGGG